MLSLRKTELVAEAQAHSCNDLRDDHPVVCKGLAAMIQAEPGMKVVGEAFQISLFDVRPGRRQRVLTNGSRNLDRMNVRAMSPDKLMTDVRLASEFESIDRLIFDCHSLIGSQCPWPLVDRISYALQNTRDRIEIIAQRNDNVEARFIFENKLRSVSPETIP